MRRISTLAILGLALTASAASAAAPDPVEQFEVRIKLDGLDVADPADDAAIKNRITLAASRACTRQRPLYVNNPVRQDCMDEITTKAFDELEAIRSSEAIN